MVYQLLIKPSAKKNLDRLPERDRGRVIAALISLEHNPFQGKELRGELKGLRSIRIWPYRVVFEIYKKELRVLVIAISHRKDVY